MIISPQNVGHLFFAGTSYKLVVLSGYRVHHVFIRLFYQSIHKINKDYIDFQVIRSPGFGNVFSDKNVVCT